MIKIGNTELDPASVGGGASPSTETGEGESAAVLDTAEIPSADGDCAAEEGSRIGESTLDAESAAEQSPPEAEIPLDADAGDGAENADGAGGEGDPLGDGADALRAVADALMRERTQLTIEREIAHLTQRFPEIRELGDVLRLKRYPEIKALVGKGYSLSDAVRLTYEDVYLARRANAAALQARTDAFSRSHLHPTRPMGEGRSDVSETQIREYLDAIPGATREQAISAYRRYKVDSKR